jgi:hypothetical protein
MRLAVKTGDDAREVVDLVRRALRALPALTSPTMTSHLLRSRDSHGDMARLMAMSDTIGTQLLHILGEHFIAYITASTPEIICQRLTTDDEPLDGDREAVLSEVAAFVEILTRATDHQESVRLQRLTDLFGAFDADAGTTVANVLRWKCGGELWQPASSNPLEQELLAQLIDIYPLFLLLDSHTVPSDTASSRLSRTLFQHPRRASFQEAVMGSDVLARLFAHADEDPPITNDSADTVGSIRTAQLVGHLVGTGWRLACLASKVPTFAEHAAGTKAALTNVVAALQNEAVTIPVRVGLTGVLLPEGSADVDLGSARLRPSDARDDNAFINTVLAGELQTTDHYGATITIKYSGDIVLEMDLPYRIEPHGPNLHQAIRKYLESLRLGLLLALDTDSPVLVVPSWTRIVEPLGPNASPSSWSDPRTIPNLNPRRLTTEELDNWKRWTNLVVDGRQPSVQVSIRRALLATERREPEDMLVDAVIVWENLFGTKQETTFRVASSLAWLLAEGIEDRKVKQRQLNDLYGLRSRIVHGSHQLDRDEAQKPYEALKIALSALRVIFRDRTDLLTEPGSEYRSNRIILGD